MGKWSDDPRIVPYGEQLEGLRCTICYADDYEGDLVHKPGCDEIAPRVNEIRQPREVTSSRRVP